MHLWWVSRWIISGIRIISGPCVAKIKTHYFFSVYPPPHLKIVPLMRYGRVRHVTDHDVIRRMRFARWLTRATNTLRICNTNCFFILTTVVWTRLSVTLYRVIKKSLCTWRLYCNHLVLRDFLITLYVHCQSYLGSENVRVTRAIGQSWNY